MTFSLFQILFLLNNLFVLCNLIILKYLLYLSCFLLYIICYTPPHVHGMYRRARYYLFFYPMYGYAPYYRYRDRTPRGLLRPLEKFGSIASGSVCENVPYALSSIYVVPSYAHAPWPMTDAPCAMAARQRQPPQPPRAAAGHAHTDTCGARSILGRLEYSVDVLVDVVSTLCRVRDQSHRDKTKHSHNTHTRDSETRTKHSVKI